MYRESRPELSSRRRGATIVLVVVAAVSLFGMAALTVDVGMMYRARQEAQQAADAAALAGAWELLDKDRLAGAPNTSDDIVRARDKAAVYAGMNPIINHMPSLRLDDVVVGYLYNPNDWNEQISFGDPNNFNTVKVIVRRDGSINGPIDLFFATVFGHTTSEVSAMAAATFKAGVDGFQIPPGGPNAGVLPLALHVDAWNNMMNGTWSSGDNWSYDESTGNVSGGPDDVLELNLYPGGGATQLPPGNFGTVDIGSTGNSTADLSRQIREGVTENDLSYHGGELRLGEDGTLMLSGDTGLSAGTKDDLAAIVGLPRVIPLFDQVSGNGNNAMFRIVGFAGIRVMEVHMTGSMNQKRVIIQPSFVVDPTATTSPGQSAFGDFVYRPVMLVR